MADVILEQAITIAYEFDATDCATCSNFENIYYPTLIEKKAELLHVLDELNNAEHFDRQAWDILHRDFLRTLNALEKVNNKLADYRAGKLDH